MITLPVLNRSEPYSLNPSKIIAVGLNYRDHLAEHARLHGEDSIPEPPSEPVLFAKTPNVLIGSGDAILIPRHLKDYGFADTRTDYEAELALVIKKRARHIGPGEALDYVLGFTAMNDVSQRNIQKSDVSGWFRGKSFDTFGPVGPQLVLTGDIGDPQNLRILARRNGQIVQEGNTADMIFPIAELIAYLSRQFTLEPGDLIATGTPSGVGPLQPGDEVEIEIEKIGVLRNRVEEEPTGD